MTKQSSIKKYIHALHEIDDIMGAMKNLAFIEINKINKFLNTQKKVVESIDHIGADFFSFYPQFYPQILEGQSTITILIGSERGFCANFNDLVLSEYQTKIASQATDDAIVIIVGEKLASKIEGKMILHEVIPGPSVAEEIPAVLQNLLNLLKTFSSEEIPNYVPGNWDVIANKLDEGRVITNAFNFLKALSVQPHESTYSFEPILYLSEQDFFHGYFEQYLLSNLHHIFYESLLSENDKRLRHLDNAKTKLEKKCTELSRKVNILRQEEITEEIENILLSVNLTSEKLSGS